MKFLQVLTIFALLSLSPHLFAEAATSAMEAAFLAKLQASVAHKDYPQFRELFYESEDKGPWLRLHTVQPYAAILSDFPRTYGFGPPLTRPDGPTSILETATPIFHDKNWGEDLHIVAEFVVTFPRPIPYAKGSNVCRIPLIIKKGNLFVVHGSFIVN